MTSYLDKVYKAMIVMPDPAIAPERVQDSLKNLLKKAGFEWLEIVRTLPARENHFVMVVDDEGKSAQKPYNPRAQYLSGYPIQGPILGGAIFLSERMGEDGGADFFDLTETGHNYIEDPDKWGEDGGFKQWLAMNDESVRYYQMRFPLPLLESPAKDVPVDVEAGLTECLGHAPAGGDGSAEPSEPEYCDGSCRQ